MTCGLEGEVCEARVRLSDYSLPPAQATAAPLLRCSTAISLAGLKPYLWMEPYSCMAKVPIRMDMR